MGDMEMLARIEALLTQQATATSSLEARVSLGDTNVQKVISDLEAKLVDTQARLVDTERKMAEALSVLAAHLTAAQASAAAAPPGLSAPSAGNPMGNDGSTQFDPWANKTLGGRAADLASAAPRPYFAGDILKSKDFAQIAVFDGDLNKFADWADRIAAKLSTQDSARFSHGQRVTQRSSTRRPRWRHPPRKA